MAVDAAELLAGLDHPGRAPAQRYLPVAPALMYRAMRGGPGWVVRKTVAGAERTTTLGDPKKTLRAAKVYFLLSLESEKDPSRKVSDRPVLAALTGERGPSGAATTPKEHIVDTTHTGTKFVRAAVLAGAAAMARRSRQMFIVLALALGTILFAVSASVAHAAPDDGTSSNDPANVPPGPTSLALPPLLEASENPVVFHGTETTRWISLTANPYIATVRCISMEDGVQEGPGAIIVAGTPTDLAGEIIYGKTYKVHLETIPENGQPKLVGPTLTITTVRVDVSTASPQPPEINPTLIPTRPDLAPPTS